MFFNGYFNSIADIVEARLKGYERDGMNPADKGELCELFIKEFLEDALGENFRIQRGGKVVNSAGLESKQLDIILCSKRTIKIFSDKGIYPTETVKGVFSVTATLNWAKLLSCIGEFASIPKTGYHFFMPIFLPEKFRIDTQRVFENLTPVKCVFAYRGDIDESWVERLKTWVNDNHPDISLLPDLIIVNKKGLIFKQWTKTSDNRFNITFHYIDYTQRGNPGDAFARIVHDLYNMSGEDLYMQPDYTWYFNNDAEPERDGQQ